MVVSNGMHMHTLGRSALFLSYITLLALSVAPAAFAQTNEAAAAEDNPGILEALTFGPAATSTTSGTTTPEKASIIPSEGQVPLEVFEARPVTSFSIFNSIAFFTQSAARSGVPTETIALILLLPFLATLTAFVRNIIGLPSLDMLVPIIFSIALLASDVVVGLLLLGIIIFSSAIARMIFKRVKIMQLPKIALSMLVVSFGVLGGLFFSGAWQVIDVRQISIVPILLFILLSERIVRLQFESAPASTALTIGTTLTIGGLGYFFLASQEMRAVILLYPELALLLVPINILIGRYFGLRVTEYLRFASLKKLARPSN